MVSPLEYGLLESPFGAVPDDDVTHWAGMRRTRDVLDDAVRSVRPDDVETSECVIMCGDYGAGKSHALRYFTWKVNSTEGYGDGPRGLAIYMSQVAIESNPKFASLYPQIIEQLEREVQPVVAENVQQAVIASYPESDRDQVLSLQRGDGFLKLKDAKDDIEAASNLASIFRIMTTPTQGNQPAYGAVYLFLDEMETLHHQAKVPAIHTYYGALRALINAVGQHFALIVSYTLQTVELEASVPQFFMERVTRPLVEIPPLEQEEAKEFIMDYLAARRPEGFSNENIFHPFSEEAIDAILERETELVPRRILRHMRRVFERAVRREGLQSGEDIPGDMAESILEMV